MDKQSAQLLIIAFLLAIGGIICILYGLSGVITKKIKNGGLGIGSWRGKEAVKQGRQVIFIGLLCLLGSLFIYLNLLP